MIVHGIKYILLLFLCVDGWFSSKFGMGPGLGSMSPPHISSRNDVCVLGLGSCSLSVAYCVWLILLLFCVVDAMFGLMCFFFVCFEVFFFTEFVFKGEAGRPSFV